jgi:hypothetical protein
MAVRQTTLRIMTFSLMTLSMKGLFETLSIGLHSALKQSAITLTVAFDLLLF